MTGTSHPQKEKYKHQPLAGVTGTVAGRPLLPPSPCFVPIGMLQQSYVCDLPRQQVEGAAGGLFGSATRPGQSYVRRSATHAEETKTHPPPQAIVPSSMRRGSAALVGCGKQRLLKAYHKQTWHQAQRVSRLLFPLEARGQHRRRAAGKRDHDNWVQALIADEDAQWRVLTMLQRTQC